MEGTGRGRSNLLDRLRQQQQELKARQLAQQDDKPEEPQRVPEVASIPTIGRGRGIAALLASAEASKTAGQESASPPTLNIGRGRAVFKPELSPPESVAPSSITSIIGRGRGIAPTISVKYVKKKKFIILMKFIDQFYF